MATVVDALVVELKLDPTNFKKGAADAGEALTKTRKSFEEDSKKIGQQNEKLVESFSSVTKSALGLFGIFVSADFAKNFIEQTTAANASLGRLGARLNESPQLIRAWGYAAERLGGSAEATANSMLSLGDKIEALRTRGEALPMAFYQIQAAGGKQIELNKGIGQTFSDLADDLQRIYKMDPQKADFLGRQLGIDPETVGLMERYGAGLGSMVNNLQKLAPSDDDIKNSQELATAWTKLAQESDAFGRSIVSDITPGLKTAVEYTSSMLDYLKKVHEEAKTMSPAEGEAARKSNADAIWKFFGFSGAPKALDEGVDRNAFVKWLSGLGIGGAKAAEAGGPNLNPLGMSSYEMDAMRSGGDREAQRARALSGLRAGDISVEGRPVSEGNPLPVAIQQAPGSSSGGLFSWLGGLFSSGGGSASAGFPGPAQGPYAPAPSGGGGGWWSRIAGGGGGSSPGTTSAGDGGGPAKPGEILDWFATTFGLTKEQALGPVGFMGFESGDFLQMHQMGAPRDTGDFGYPQYSGPRRTKMEAWVHANMPGVDPASDAAQKAYLEWDVKTNYAGMLAKLRSQPSGDQTFETWARDYQMGSPWYDRDPATVAQHRAKMEQYRRHYGNVSTAPRMPLFPHEWTKRDFGTAPGSSDWSNDWLHMSRDDRVSMNMPAGGDTHHHHSTSVGNVTIHTQASDAKTIAQEFSRELELQRMAEQANYGIV